MKLAADVEMSPAFISAQRRKGLSLGRSMRPIAINSPMPLIHPSNFVQVSGRAFARDRH